MEAFIYPNGLKQLAIEVALQLTLAQVWSLKDASGW